MNALKNALSLVISALSVLAFSQAGLIHWPLASVMMVGAMLGGYAAARVAKRLPAVWVQRLVIITGLGMSAVFLTS